MRARSNVSAVPYAGVILGKTHLAGCPSSRLRIFLRRCGGMAHAGEEDATEWEILLTGEVESFLDDLYESDPASHQLVNQAILVLERNGPRKGARWWTRSRRLGSRT